MKISWVLFFGCITLWASVAHGQEDSLEDDFEVFQLERNGQRSQSISPDPNYNFGSYDIIQQHNVKKRSPSLARLPKISADSPITHLYDYISPESASRRFVRATPREKEAHDYTDEYKAFLEKYFSDSKARSGAITAASSDYDSEDDHRGNYKSGPYDDEQPASKSKRKKSENLRRANEEDVEYVHDDDRVDGQYNDSEYERIKALSDQQQEEINKNPKNCKVVLKDGMQCNVCKNPETGAHSETCSFNSQPKDKKYAYLKERNYNSKDDDEDDSGEEATAEAAKQTETTVVKPASSNANYSKVKANSAATTTRSTPAAPRHRARSANIRAATTTTTTTKKPVARRSNRGPYKAEESRPQERRQEYEKNKRSASTRHSNDDYFSKIFPAASRSAIRSEKLKAGEAEDNSEDVEFIPNYNENRGNVEDVLAAFKEKDWSKCKKVIKNDLTCYHCKDEDGVRHEECVFVSGSGDDEPPKTSRLAYSETKEFKRDPADYDENGNYNPETKDDAKAVEIIKGNNHAHTTDKSADIVSVAEKPSQVVQHQKSGNTNEKKTIKRMVSYRSADFDTLSPTKSMVFEHSYVHHL